MTAPLNLDGPPLCVECGAPMVVTEHVGEGDGGASLWSAACWAGLADDRHPEWVDLTERPTLRDQPGCAPLVAEIERLRAALAADRWAVYDPIEERYDFHGTDGSALQALDGIVDALRDRSSREVEGWDDNADQAAVYALVRIAGLELRTVATAGDGTEEGETCQRNGWSHIAEAEIVRVGDSGSKG